jgi:hypothetical protein
MKHRSSGKSYTRVSTLSEKNTYWKNGRQRLDPHAAPNQAAHVQGTLPPWEWDCQDVLRFFAMLSQDFASAMSHSE